MTPLCFEGELVLGVDEDEPFSSETSSAWELPFLHLRGVVGPLCVCRALMTCAGDSSEDNADEDDTMEDLAAKY